MIDIFVGRNNKDVSYLMQKYVQQKILLSNSKLSLSSLISSLTSNPELNRALQICFEITRPDSSQFVHIEDVLRDVDEIIKWLDNPALFTRNVEALFNILLRRSDHHIVLIDTYFNQQKGIALDNAIRKNTCLSKMASRILVHAVRSATHISYRDAVLLSNSSSLIETENNEKLAIRVCRMHWDRQHWRQVNADYLRYKGVSFLEKMRKKKGLFGYLMLAMAMVGEHYQTGRSSDFFSPYHSLSSLQPSKAARMKLGMKSVPPSSSYSLFEGMKQPGETIAVGTRNQIAVESDQFVHPEALSVVSEARNSAVASTDFVRHEISLNYPQNAMKILEAKAQEIDELLEWIHCARYDVLVGYDIMPPDASANPYFSDFFYRYSFQ